MAASGTFWSNEIVLWIESDTDRRFRNILRWTLLVFLLLGLVFPFLPLPEISREKLERVPPRLAQVIIERHKQPPPKPKPIPKPVEPPKAAERPKPKPVEPPKAVEKKPEPPKPAAPEKAAKARKKAESAGLLAMRDELADLRQSFNVAQVQNSKPQYRGGQHAAPENRSPSGVLTAKAGQGSGGINTRNLSRDTGGQALAGRSTTAVSSSIAQAASAATGRGTDGRLAGRSMEEIQLVFDRNKGAIYTLYNRALRQDPTLRGKVVVRLIIAPSGRVTGCELVSSELRDPELERKLVARIRLFNFGAKDVGTVSVNYPIDFLPS